MFRFLKDQRPGETLFDVVKRKRERLRSATKPRKYFSNPMENLAKKTGRDLKWTLEHVHQNPNVKFQQPKSKKSKKKKKKTKLSPREIVERVMRVPASKNKHYMPKKNKTPLFPEIYKTKKVRLNI